MTKSFNRLWRMQQEAQYLIAQLDDHMYSLGDQFKHPLHKLLGMDKELRNIRGSLKVELVKKSSWKNASRKKSISFPELKMTQNASITSEKTSGIGSKG